MPVDANGNWHRWWPFSCCFLPHTGCLLLHLKDLFVLKGSIQKLITFYTECFTFWTSLPLRHHEVKLLLIGPSALGTFRRSPHCWQIRAIFDIYTLLMQIIHVQYHLLAFSNLLRYYILSISFPVKSTDFHHLLRHLLLPIYSTFLSPTCAV